MKIGNQIKPFGRVRHQALAGFLACLAFLLSQPGRIWGGELQAVWADAFHPGYLNQAEAARLIADVRAAHCPTVLLEVRKRGLAYYDSRYEPKARELQPGFDPLATVLALARNTNTGPRVEVHAWIIPYVVFGNDDALPLPTNHPFVLHPDWVCLNSRGANHDGRLYAFDPGHPEVQQHVFNIAMEIVSRYDVDGLNLDWLRYPGKDWGYNPVAVARFNQRFGKTGQPSSTDTNWCQFRRDQITALLRKIYLSAIAIKPNLKISAATIAWPPVPTDTKDWVNQSAAYSHVFQDWRGWMEEGILDMNLPMLYLSQQQPRNQELYAQWVKFAVAHRYDRHVVISPAAYLNTIPDTLDQIRIARTNGADGVCLYSYASYAKGEASRDTFTAALIQPGGYNKDLPPVFAKPVTSPEMPWKTKPTKGHLKGFIYGGGSTNALDGATVTLSGPVQRKQTSDATGFYGFVDLAPGNYLLEVAFDKYAKATNVCAVSIGKVATVDISLEPIEPSAAVGQ